MFPNLFVLNGTGEVLIEKHWEGKVPRNVVDLFMEQQLKKERKVDVSPVIETPKLYLVHTRRGDVILLTTVKKETAPLFILEIHNKIMQVMYHYFGPTVNSRTIRDNFTLIYHLLDEMVDGGFPFTTDINQLQAMIQPPTIVNKFMSTFANSDQVKKALPEGMLTKIPWRRTGVKYHSNEICFDLLEEINCIIERNSNVAVCEVKGSIVCTCRLSGMPDIVLTVSHPSLIQDAVLHRSVRINRFRRERVVSFVPPDGRFTLLTYFLRGPCQMPVFVRPSINYTNGTGNVNISIGSKMREQKPIEDVVLVIPFPKEMLSSNLSTNAGSVTTVETAMGAHKEVHWTIPRLPKDKTPVLEGSVLFPNGFKPTYRPTLVLQFNAKSWNTSGLSVEGLDVVDVKYKPFRGVRTATRAGKFHIRC
mmetsp:Transcript_3552/g.4828  ORF Transcript_3552/g.4828 Transcript_3552/m.4828 type:complete len:419 (-) Transcript_3552:244-1500(-)|eukprot:CAMPEP_0185268242 /NCGR_PEP_ID=MMETSP1359-20130426/36569_1 /TAXON_ID=552665 /ORGANISM="Bigelowiella longifila, Strain CCMP242" /LENGTH=418 /DNA_ID=CAMNT_0027858929 /DNA_START=32 /DNA_END=1288 /DNA_ORIENTATION=+